MYVSLVLLTFGLVSTGHGVKTSRRQSHQKSESESPKDVTKRPKTSESPKVRSVVHGPKLLSKTPLSEIQSKNPISSQQNELQSIIDTMNKALMQNQEIKTVFSRNITANNFV